ncbi:hypothetical protein EVG20_g11333 [Dentipellis fragilis]|uniref:Uncharacterized protein n=1 Tax=Dentipellis fragilis TaxID=205917 RepID=A0A4Y9XM12_9AGAM|nr:hypothetical protein EVG20_g11333 [Dentipellis fragilis]
MQVRLACEIGIEASSCVRDQEPKTAGINNVNTVKHRDCIQVSADALVTFEDTNSTPDTSWGAGMGTGEGVGATSEMLQLAAAKKDVAP